MTDLLKAEVIEALASSFYESAGFERDDSMKFSLALAAARIRSFDLTPFQVKVPEDIRSVLRNVDCQCKLVERESGHRTDCWRPELDSLIESLAAQLAERDREIVQLKALLTECRKREVLDEVRRPHR